MEPQNNLRLLFISMCLVISINSARSRLAPDVSPSPSPILKMESTYTIASPPANAPSTYIQSSISESPSETPISSPKSDESYSVSSTSTSTPSTLSSSEFVQPAEFDDFSTTSLFSNSEDFSSKLQSVKSDPQVSKICDNTDHPPLCMATILPLLKGKANVESVLRVAVQAGGDYAKEALSVAKKLAEKPGTSPELLSTLKDCKDSYDTAVENFAKTTDAFATRDIGTMRSVLSAVITFVGDCEDEFAEMQSQSPLAGYAEKLTDMASNCLAIVSQMN
ncbi:hypothetical protein DH2020_020100 [Rehmannia glutinosa]|uniref:Pectinesterase inhibitor domain-containing protein n=1 Tax=Rehmannia glutinosa TaxID=99300 RepID=A0ABR0UIZ0_REHGL